MRSVHSEDDLEQYLLLRKEAAMEERQTPKPLRYTLLAHAVSLTLFSLIYLLIPVPWGDWTGCLSNQVPQVFRLFGTSLLGYAISSFLAYRQTAFDRVKITVQTACALHAVFFTVIVLALALWDLPQIGWLYAVFTGGFAIAFNLQYFSLHRTK